MMKRGSMTRAKPGGTRSTSTFPGPSSRSPPRRMVPSATGFPPSWSPPLCLSHTLPPISSRAIAMRGPRSGGKDGGLGKLTGQPGLLLLPLLQRQPPPVGVEGAHCAHKYKVRILPDVVFLPRCQASLERSCNTLSVKSHAVIGIGHRCRRSITRAVSSTTRACVLNIAQRTPDVPMERTATTRIVT